MNEIKSLNLIKNSAWLNDENTQRLFTLLGGDEKRTKAVGGIVRDTLMGTLKENNDIDFATELSPDEVIERAKKAGYKYYPTGIEHGTISIAVGGRLFEVTTLRQDIETDGRHAKVVFGADWLLDAKRRDFTINALYVASDASLFDPLGCGVNDCLTNTVRFIGDADKRIAEDKLRVYRFFRFSASHGGQKFDNTSLKACKKAANNLTEISAERIGMEMMKMLALKKITKVFKLLMEIKIFPQNDEILKYFFHLEEITKSPTVNERLALLFKQIDKKILQKKWRLSNAQCKKSLLILTIADMLANGEVNNAAYQISKENWPLTNSTINVAAALFNWKIEQVKSLQEQVNKIKVPPFEISGKDLLDAGFNSGAKLGQQLAMARQLWIESGFRLNKEQLLKKIKN